MTAFCPKCQADIEVPWFTPPYSVRHTETDGVVEHRHPVHRDLRAHVVLPTEAFDRLAAELDEPARDIPALRALVEKHSSTCNPSSCPVCHARATREALARLDGSTGAAISLLTGETREDLDALGGFGPTVSREDCPDAPHRGPQGPNEDTAVCSHCWAPSWALRPEGETFGDHLPDCSLPLRHEGHCEPGGNGHPRAEVIRGYWPGGETSAP